METRRRVIEGAYTVSFKRRHSGRLLNLHVSQAKDVCDASRQAQTLVQRQHPHEGWHEYGVSRVHTIEELRTYYTARGMEQEWKEVYRG